MKNGKKRNMKISKCMGKKDRARKMTGLHRCIVDECNWNEMRMGLSNRLPMQSNIWRVQIEKAASTNAEYKNRKSR